MGQRELVLPTRKRHTAQANIEFIGYSEVRQPEPTGWERLREVDLALAAMSGAPLADPPLQRAQHRFGKPFRVAPLQRLKHLHSHQCRHSLEHWNHFSIPHRCQWGSADASVAQWVTFALKATQ